MATLIDLKLIKDKEKQGGLLIAYREFRLPYIHLSRNYRLGSSQERVHKKYGQISGYGSCESEISIII